MPKVMRQVQSEAIIAVGYDSDTKTLYIEFNKSKAYPTYEFTPVSAHTAGRMLTARSVGSYYHRIIKTRSHYATTPSSRQVVSILGEKSSGSLLDIAFNRVIG